MKFIILQGRHLGFQVNGIQITMKKAQGLEEEHLALCRAHPTAIPTYTKISRMGMGSWLNGTGASPAWTKARRHNISLLLQDQMWSRATVGDEDEDTGKIRVMKTFHVMLKSLNLILAMRYVLPPPSLHLCRHLCH